MNKNFSFLHNYKVFNFLGLLHIAIKLCLSHYVLMKAIKLSANMICFSQVAGTGQVYYLSFYNVLS